MSRNPCNRAIVICACLPHSSRPITQAKNLSSLLERGWEALDVIGELAVVAQELDVCTINENLSGGLLLHVLLATERGETPVLGDDDLLASWELVLGAAESLESDGAVWRLLVIG